MNSIFLPVPLVGIALVRSSRPLYLWLDFLPMHVSIGFSWYEGKDGGEEFWGISVMVLMFRLRLTRAKRV